MKRIQLMRTTPVVSREGDEVEIRGRSRAVFRLLILLDGSTVDHNAIASLYAKETANKSGLSRTRMRDLRIQLGGPNVDLIQVIRASGYSARIDDWEVDSRSFEKTVRSLNASYDDLLSHPTPPEQARNEIRTLTEALKDWEVNPAEGLYEEGRYDDGLGLKAKWDLLKQEAEDRLVMSQLYSQDDYHMRKAMSTLQIKAKISPEDAVWRLLLLAEHARGIPSETIRRDIEKHYKGKGDPPHWLLAMLIATSNNTLVTNPFLAYASGTRSASAGSTASSSAKSRALPASNTTEGDTLIGLCKSLGISTHSNLRLTDSHLAPLSCIRRTRLRLDFSGVLASKWVTEPHVRAELDSLLHRLDREEGAVRFLIINPNGSAFKRLSAMRNGQLSKESLVHLNDLIGKHKSFSVRVFDSLPAFRIVSIDDDVMSFSPYRLDAAAYLASGRGWETPYIVLDQLAEYPLAEAFQLLFNENWKSAQPLQDLP